MSKRKKNEQNNGIAKQKTPNPRTLMRFFNPFEARDFKNLLTKGNRRANTKNRNPIIEIRDRGDFSRLGGFVQHQAVVGYSHDYSLDY